MTILYFVLSLLILLINGNMNFQRNIWVYWETDFDKAPLITKVSYEKLQKAAIQADWKLVLINGSNIKNFLKDYDRFQEVVKKGRRNTVQQKSDILRISLVEQNGGVWIDFACILFDDLQWLSNEKLFEHMIINRIGSNLQDPDMFMLGEGWHQSPLSYYNENGNLVTDEYFGMAIHFIAAKKKSKIMTEWKQKMYRISSLPYSQLIGEINQKRLYFHNIDRNDVYYSGNIALQSVIQEKQFQFDDNLTLFSTRKNAYEHYKIWMIHGQVGPIAMTRKHIIGVRDLFMETKQEIQKRTGRLWFYLKLAKYLRQNIEDDQKPAQNYFKNNKNLTIEKILKRGPTNEQCSLRYIVEGSILYNFYKDSKYENQIHTPYITVQQREELKKHCQFIAPSNFFSSYTPKSEGQMTKPQRQLFYKEQNTIGEKIAILWKTNTLVLKAGIEQWRTIMFMLIVYIVFRNTSMKDLLKAFLERYRNQFNQKIPFYQMLSNRLNTLKTTFQQGNRPVEYKQVKWSREKSIAVFILFIKTILGSISLQFYENIQDMGKYPQYELTLLIMVLIFLVDGWLQKLIKRTHFPSNMFVQMGTISQAMRFPIYLPLGFAIFIHWDIVYGFTYYHTLVIVGGGILLYMILQETKRNRLGNWYINFIMFLMQISKWICLLIFIAFYMINNLRYIRKDHRYVKQSISDIVMYSFSVLFVSTILYLNINLIKKLISTENQHQQQQQRNGQQKLNIKINRLKVKILLLSVNLVWLVVYRTYDIYNQIKESPSSHGNMVIFQFVILVFIACGFSTQLQLPPELDKRRKITLILFCNSLPCIYVIFGLYMLDRIFLNWVVNLLIFIAVSPYVVAVGFITEQLCIQDLDHINREQDGDIEYQIVQSHQEIKYDSRH